METVRACFWGFTRAERKGQKGFPHHYLRIKAEKGAPPVEKLIIVYNQL